MIPFQVGNDAHVSRAARGVLVVCAYVLTVEHGCLCCDCLLTGSLVDRSLLHGECKEPATFAHTSRRGVVALSIAVVYFRGVALLVAHGLRHGDTLIFAPLSDSPCTARPAGSISHRQINSPIACEQAPVECCASSSVARQSFSLCLCRSAINSLCAVCFG